MYSRLSLRLGPTPTHPLSTTGTTTGTTTPVRWSPRSRQLKSMLLAARASKFSCNVGREVADIFLGLHAP